MTHILHAIPRLAAGLAVFAVFWLLAGGLERLVSRIGQRADVPHREGVRFLGRLAKLAVIALGAISALGAMSVNVSAMVAGLGLTGFALGFALRDAISNLLAGVLILVYRPFQLQDRIAVAGYEGTVITIDLRYTTLREAGKRFLIPNAVLFTNPVTLLEPERPGRPIAAAAPYELTGVSGGRSP